MAVKVIDDRQRVEKIIDDMTLFDDDLMSRVFDKNIEATELLLKIVLERDDIKVIKVDGQEELKNPVVGGRNIKLDIIAEDKDGVRFNVEVQRSTEGSHPRRARFHSSALDSRLLKENEAFKDLKDSYVIFICEHDKFHQGNPIYHVDKIIRETNEKYEDGAHIIYVNGKYKGNDPIGKLMHDFSCRESKTMYYGELAGGVKHFKETEEGREEMCESVLKYADEKAEMKQIKSVKNLMKNGNFSLEQALDMLGIDGEEREKIIQQIEE